MADLAGALAAVTVIGCVALLVTAGAQVARAQGTAHGPVYELDTASTVAWARCARILGTWRCSSPTATQGMELLPALLPGLRPGGPGRTADRRRPPRLPVRPSEQARLRGLLDGDPKIGEVFVVAPINVRPERLDAVTRLLAGAGFRPRDRIRPPLSESVRRFTRG